MSTDTLVVHEGPMLVWNGSRNLPEGYTARQFAAASVHGAIADGQRQVLTNWGLDSKGRYLALQVDGDVRGGRFEVRVFRAHEGTWPVPQAPLLVGSSVLFGENFSDPGILVQRGSRGTAEAVRAGLGFVNRHTLGNMIAREDDFADVLAPKGKDKSWLMAADGQSAQYGSAAAKDFLEAEPVPLIERILNSILPDPEDLIRIRELQQEILDDIAAAPRTYKHGVNNG